MNENFQALLKAYYRYPITGLCLLAVFCLSTPASAQDYIGMAIQYGNNMQNILHTEIMNDAGRQVMKQATGNKKYNKPVAPVKWPAHINAAGIAGHIFTVAELAAMHGSDPVKTRQLISGKTITVEGTVKLPDRDGLNAFHLISGNGGYNVWVYYARNPVTVRHGATVRVQGVAAVERRSYLTLRSPKLVSSNAVAKQPTASTGSNSVQPAKAANYQALKFSSGAAVTKQSNQLIADRLAASLKQGVSKADLQKILEEGELQKAFVNVSRENGFSVNDLADVLTVAMVLGWQIANDVPEIDEKAGYQAIRKSIREELARTAWIAPMNNDQKQLIAELTGTGMMVIVSRYMHGRQQQQSSVIRQSAADARQFIQELTGMDLQRFKLTQKGFVSK